MPQVRASSTNHQYITIAVKLANSRGIVLKGQGNWIGSKAKKVTGLLGELCNINLGNIE